MNFKQFISIKLPRAIKNHKKIIAGILLIIVAFILCQRLFGGNTQTTVNTATASTTTKVSVGSISQTIKVEGQAELVDEQQLRFNQAGKITAVYFAAGDTVKKDQVIAELDKTDALNEIEQAEINLQNSQLSLQDLLDGATDNEILQAKNNISETEASLETSKKELEVLLTEKDTTFDELENEIEQAQKDVDSKQRSLENAQAELESTIAQENESLDSSTNTYQAAIDSGLLNIKDAITSADNILSSLDNILCIESSTKANNDAYEYYLGALAVNTKTEAERSYKLARSKRDSLEEAYNELAAKNDVTIDDVIALMEDAEPTFEQLIDASDNTYEMLKNSITGLELSSNELSSFKSSALSARSSAENTMSSFQNNITSLKNQEDLGITELKVSDTIRAKQNSVSDAEDSLEKAQDTLDNLQKTLATKKANEELSITSKQNTITNLENSLTEQQNDLADLEDGADEIDIIKATNEVTQKKLALANVQENVDNYELIAPFDGVLRDIDFKVGDNIVSDDDKYAYIENPDILEIIVLLDQIDIIGVQEGMPATIVFDALPDKTFTSEVNKINETPQESSGVISYEVSILLEREDKSILSGMTTTVEIITEQAENVLVVPNLALSTKDGKTFVQKMENGKTIEVEVETGASDDNNTEILSGLSEGDEIMVQSFAATMTNSSSGETNGQDSMQQLMRATNSGGGSGPPG